MNEQLIVKNFGPFQKEEVKAIFRRITVFIGPSGGGKSTLAKLAAIFWDKSYSFMDDIEEHEKKFLIDYSLEKYYSNTSQVTFSIDKKTAAYIDFSSLSVAGMSGISNISSGKIRLAEATELLKKAQNAIAKAEKMSSEQKAINLVKKAEELYTEGRKIIELTLSDAKSNFYKRNASFFPANRIIIPSVEYSWPGFLRDDIGLPKEVLNFANFFSISRKDVLELDIPFLNVKYIHQNGQDLLRFLA